MAKIIHEEVILESEEEDKRLIEDIEDNLKRSSNKELIKECFYLTKKLL